MTCSSCSPSINTYGSDPVVMQWKVVRGDTATLQVNFLENDEITPIDTSTWSYKATSYDPQGNVLDNLPIEASVGSITVVAPASTTDRWGTTYSDVVAELRFDIRITMPGEGNCDIVWTPVIGTICVIGNVTPGGSL